MCVSYARKGMYIITIFIALASRLFGKNEIVNNNSRKQRIYNIYRVFRNPLILDLDETFSNKTT